MNTLQQDDMQDSAIPLLKTLGAEIVSRGQRRAVIKLASRPELADTGGGLNGAIIASVVNIAALVAVKALGTSAVNVETATNFFSPVYLGSELIVESEVIHVGGKLIHTEVYVLDGEFLVAKGKATFFTID